MKSPGPHNSDGFTILELIVVIGIFSVLILIATPALFGTYSRANVSSEQSNIVSYLRSAQSWSFANRDDNKHGVYFGTTKYTLFTGNTYAQRITSLDEDHNKPTQITISGTNEIVFEKRSGRTSPITIIITGDTASKSIGINSEGLISW